jgi:hypothetical protein
VKRNRKRPRQEPDVIQVWTYEQAIEALPYVASIVGSLREDRLEAVRNHLKARRFDERSGRLGRTELIAQQEVIRAATEAEDRFQSALEELHTLDIYCFDPIRGLALIPFGLDDQLAWYVFDFFDGKALRFWRYHKDPLETRRSVSDVPAAAGPDDSGSMVI